MVLRHCDLVTLTSDKPVCESTVPKEHSPIDTFIIDTFLVEVGHLKSTMTLSKLAVAPSNVRVVTVTMPCVLTEAQWKIFTTGRLV